MLKKDNEPQLVDTTDLTDAAGIRKARPKGLRESFRCFVQKGPIKLAQGSFGLLPKHGQRTNERPYGCFGSNSRRIARHFGKYGTLPHQALAALRHCGKIPNISASW